MTRSVPSLTLAVPKTGGIAAYGASVFLHALALGCALTLAFGASGTLPDVVGYVDIRALPVPEMATPVPPPAERPPAVKGRQPVAAQRTLADAAMRAPIEVPDAIPEPPDLLVGDAADLEDGPGVLGGGPRGLGRARSPIGGLDLPVAVASPPIVRMSSVAGPRKVFHVPPVYPQVAIDARIQGKVELDCVIDEDGRVTSVTVLQGNAVLTPAAVDAVRQWRYTPTLVTGVRTPVIMKVTVQFGLTR